MRKRRAPDQWYAQPDDLIGGWCVMTADMPPSQATPENGVGMVASFAKEADARHIAFLHNFENPPWSVMRRYVLLGMAGGLVGGTGINLIWWLV